MTDREKAIVTAYTGIMMLSGDKMDTFIDYVSEKIGHRVMTHELGHTETWDEIKKVCSEDFFELCKVDGNTVYVVTAGCYSDYHICGVTTKEKQAECWADSYSDIINDARVETWPLATRNGDDRSAWIVKFKGDAIQGVRWDNRGQQTMDRNFWPHVYDFSWTADVEIGVLAKDEEHAKKIAKDAYMKWKAEREGVV